LAKVFIVLILVGLIDGESSHPGGPCHQLFCRNLGRSCLCDRLCPYRGLRRLNGYVEQQDQRSLSLSSRAGRVTALFSAGTRA
jgi:hypothetical protein